MTAPRPRPEILDISPYVGGESTVPGVNRVLKLSSNEGAFGVPPGAQEAYRRMAEELHRYPDGDATELRRAIGARFRLDPARIVCGAGSDDLIYQLCLAYGGHGRDIVMSAHGFAIYHIAGTYAGSRVIKTPERNLTADVDAMLAAVSPATRLVFLANPNNPTGSMLPYAEVARLRAGLPPEVLLVLDAAYAEYVERPDYDPGMRAGRCRRQHGDAADLLQDLRPGRHADRLGLCAAGGDRRVQPGALAVQRVDRRRRRRRSRRWPSPAGWRRAARTTPNTGRSWRRGWPRPASRSGRPRAISSSPISRTRGARQGGRCVPAHPRGDRPRRWAATACRTACASPSAPPRRSSIVIDDADGVHARPGWLNRCSGAWR